ncbi:MAG: hypothetical protein M1832_002001 [Thelocarpon impressellum]|nr:MAG: hypothetical protein M1832_002001 [Thelocarpon impressellum]
MKGATTTLFLALAGLLGSGAGSPLFRAWQKGSADGPRSADPNRSGEGFVLQVQFPEDGPRDGKSLVQHKPIFLADAGGLRPDGTDSGDLIIASTQWAMHFDLYGSGENKAVRSLRTYRFLATDTQSREVRLVDREEQDDASKYLWRFDQQGNLLSAHSPHSAVLTEPAWKVCVTNAPDLFLVVLAGHEWETGRRCQDIHLHRVPVPEGARGFTTSLASILQVSLPQNQAS